MLVHRVAGGLHHEHIHAAHVQELEVLAVGKALDLGLAHGDADVAANLLCKRPVGRPAEELEALVFAQIAGPLALGGRLGLLRLAAVLEPASCAAFLDRCRLSPAGYSLPLLPSTFPLHLRLPPSWVALAVFRVQSLKNLAGRLGFEPRQVPPKGTVLH